MPTIAIRTIDDDTGWIKSAEVYDARGEHIALQITSGARAPNHLTSVRIGHLVVDLSTEGVRALRDIATTIIDEYQYAEAIAARAGRP